jgi:DNA-damage-inducible protein J
VTPAELLKLVLQHLANGGDLPFSTLIPNAETIEAMEAARRGETFGSARSVEELMAELRADN